ncbi:6-pyruvoyl trahydropterin synthase family protein [Chitinimonas sp. BJB300]|uniref:6-pyruvoyl trahydropterin synthase family protein n=1 Tax=Chitinimonas sp. BJB300 TaxID=1559339 RepID=UPI000C1016FD|nr:6-carboxytetrahydropterin synthase [Chitinimonas sp. BJB300]PHV13233.1 6-pyruvoyl tetrahydropterin synthase [Chitinimonas sp. BJB300]TSJ89626.1 6-pyruvoyl tetrahydropterin synthase [Chitinimonas sp. BJB300]
MRQDRLAIRIDRDDIGFAAAHFTIFSATEREGLHGHNFTVGMEVVARGEENGMIFDYRLLKSRLRALCAELDERMLLPARSAHLQISRIGNDIECRFADDKFTFPYRDVVMLELPNITLEALAEWFLGRLLVTTDLPREYLAEMSVSVASSRGQQARRQAILS